MSGIFYIDYYIPEELIPVEEVIRNTAHVTLPEGYTSIDDYCSDFKLQSKLDKIAFGDKKNAIEIFKNMFLRFLNETKIDPNDIDYFISVDLYSNTSTEISISSYLQKEFGINNAAMFSLHQGCGSTLVSMGMSKKLLDVKGKYMLIISSCFAPTVNNRYIQATVVGDALGMMVLSSESTDFEIIDYISASDGTLSHDKYNDIKREPDVISVIGKGVKTIKTLLTRNSLNISDIYMMIPQNINHQGYVNLYAKMLNLNPEKLFLENIPKGGHLGDVDIMRNFKDFSINNTIPEEANILLYGLGGPEGKDKSYDAVLVKYSPK